VTAGPQKGRTLPTADDAERSVLGGILLDNRGIDDVLEVLKPQDFYRQAHRKVFEAMATLGARTEPIDRVSVKAELERAGVFASIGGDPFVDLLDKVVPAASNLVYYARIVADAALRRRVIETAQAIAAEGYEREGTAKEFAERAEAKLFDAAATTKQIGFVSAASQLVALEKLITASYEKPGAITGAPSGMAALDELTCGYQGGDLVVIGGRPSMGKSAIALDAARATARATAEQGGGTVAFFSLEMPTMQQMLRLAAVEGKVNLSSLRNGKLTEPEWGKLAVGFGLIGALAIEFDDKATSLSEIRASSRRLASRQAGTDKPLRMVVVDYLQLMDHGQQEFEREDQAIGRTTKGLKALAKQLQIPVLLLSQLSRRVEERPDKRPRPSDLRESGNIEQDSDLILFPYRGEVYGDKACPEGTAEIIVGKQRMGPTGMAKVAFVKTYASFCDLDRAPTRQPSFFDGPPPHTDEDR
jgi:replicative DNA helicase